MYGIERDTTTQLMGFFMEASGKNAFVNWFRHTSPYVHAFRGRTFVVTFSGEAIRDERFAHLVHDITLLSNLGIRLVLVHGARPQIEARLTETGAELHYVNGLRVTDSHALRCVKEAVGATRMEIEAKLSMGLANSPMAGVRIRTATGNFVTARPVGIRGGVDYQHTGEVRRIEAEAIKQHLANGAIVLLSPIGYSPTGEIFNLSALDVATETAVALGAEKLLCLTEHEGLKDSRRRLLRQLKLSDAEKLLNNPKYSATELASYLASAVSACRRQVKRVHLLNRHIDGALLLELFTRDGIGTLINADNYENTRRATIDDVGGIIELIAPLEAEGILVRRSREQLELDINHFHVVERDGAVIACAAYYPYPDDKAAELACLAVHSDYQDSGRGAALLESLEAMAKQQNIKRLFVLTTRTLHWFREKGFVPAEISSLPMKKQALYNYQRNSKVLVKNIR